MDDTTQMIYVFAEPCTINGWLRTLLNIRHLPTAKTTA